MDRVPLPQLREQVRQRLALMGQPKDARLTHETAQQISEQTWSAAVLERLN
jgi:hypothetical protein